MTPVYLAGQYEKISKPDCLGIEQLKRSCLTRSGILFCFTHITLAIEQSALIHNQTCGPDIALNDGFRFKIDTVRGNNITLNFTGQQYILALYLALDFAVLTHNHRIRGLDITYHAPIDSQTILNIQITLDPGSLTDDCIEFASANFTVASFFHNGLLQHDLSKNMLGLTSWAAIHASQNPEVSEPGFLFENLDQADWHLFVRPERVYCSHPSWKKIENGSICIFRSIPDNK
jgi:hypothetical protein